MAEKENNGPKVPLLENQISFCDYVFHMVDTINMVNETWLKKYKDIDVEIQPLKKELDNLITSQEPKPYNEAMGLIYKFRKKTEERRKYGFALDIAPVSFFYSFVAEFERFLNRLMNESLLIESRPLKNVENLSLKPGEDIGSHTPEEYFIKKYMIQYDRFSYQQKINIFNTFYKITIDKRSALWKKYITLFECRHCLIHQGGIPSKDLLIRLKKQGIKLPLDEKGKITQIMSLLAYALFCFYTLSNQLTISLLTKYKLYNDDNKDEINVYVTNSMFQPLDNEQYDLCSLLFNNNFKKVKKLIPKNEFGRQYFIVNAILAEKFSKKGNIYKKFGKDIDWKENEKIIGAKLLIDGKNKQFFNYLTKNKEAYSLTEIKEWPLFKFVRKDVKFIKLCEKLYGKEFFIEN